jgi:hypothetical protein
VERTQQLDRTKMQGTDSNSGPTEELPYRVELWRSDGRDAVERVLARAFNVELAGAIFRAARDEYPERRITLSKGDYLIADSAK